MTVKLTLDDLVTSVATDLMGVTAGSLHSASELLLHQLVDYFEVDLSFLRRNDHELGATVPGRTSRSRIRSGSSSSPPPTRRSRRWRR
jgi:hypothetical protein